MRLHVPYRTWIILSFIALLTASTLSAQSLPPQNQHPRYIYGRVWLSETFSLYDAEEAGVELEHARIKSGSSVSGSSVSGSNVEARSVEAYFTDWTLDVLQRKGVKVDVLVADAEARNRDRIARMNARRALKPQRNAEVAAPANFQLGSMGGFYTLAELYEQFARMKRLFPDLISEPMKIGESIEARPLYVYRVGTAQSQTDKKPEVLYTALHHAREPGSASNLIYTLWNLLERYAAGDPEARYLLNNRQLYLVPVVNPDGYAYNESRNPSGGGLWRKNRRNNGNAIGVDLNRNYGTMEFWDAPNNGSSTATGNDTYRGTEPFSEPETQAIRSLCRTRNFKTAINYHTFSNLLIYPYSYTAAETPDSTYFRAICAEITKVNKYSGGRDLQTVGYSVRGASDDWMYAEVDGHGKIMAMTPEVGSIDDNFWPDADRIAPQGAENLATNLQTAWSAETNLRPVQTYTTENPQTGRTRINVEVQNIGIVQAKEEYTLSLRPLGSLAENVTLETPQRTLKRLRSSEVQREVFNVQTDSMVRNGARVPVEITIVQEGVPRRDTTEIQLYQPKRIPVFTGDAANWNLGRWGVVVDPFTARLVLHDTPNTTYRNRDKNYVQTKQTVNLSGMRAATLEFQTRWSVEANYDFAVIQASDDGGATWKYLRSSMMRSGLDSPGSAQVPDGYGFDGNFPIWIRQECSLDAFLGKEILLRLGVLTDDGGSFDGIYLSDMYVRGYTDAPTFVATARPDLKDLRVAPSVILSESEVQLVLPSSFKQSQVRVQFANLLGQIVFDTRADVFEGVAALRNPFLPQGVYVVIVSDDAASARQQVLIGK